MTIHCEVPVALDLEQMRTQAPDVSACRALFNELEFTTMLKELAPDEQESRSPSSTIHRPKRLTAFVEQAGGHGFALAFDTTLLEVASEQVAEEETEAIEEEEPQLKNMSLLGLFDTPALQAEARSPDVKNCGLGGAGPDTCLFLDPAVIVAPRSSYATCYPISKRQNRYTTLRQRCVFLTAMGRPWSAVGWDHDDVMLTPTSSIPPMPSIAWAMWPHVSPPGRCRTGR